MHETVRQTLLSPVYDVAIITPLSQAKKLTVQHGCNILLKREDLQPVHSFKLRGAYNKIAQLSSDQLQAGVITASAGNHAQGVALSAQHIGIQASIVMPRTTPQIKVDAVAAFGATVVLFGDSYSEAYEHSLQLQSETGATYIHPFDDPLVIAGQATIGKEIIEQHPQVTHIIVPIGGGGLIAGVAQYVKTLRPDITVIGVEPIDSNAMYQSIHANRRVTLPHVGIFADGVAVKQVGKHTFSLAKKYVDTIVTVTNDQICAAIKSVFEDTRSILEPAGALAVAGLSEMDFQSSDNVVAICSGANMNFERLQYVAERTLIGSGNEALFNITLPERPGAMRALCKDVIGAHTITEFNYRLQDRESAHILMGIAMKNPADRQQVIDMLARHSYQFTDISNDDVAKQHIRHMIGGKNHIVGNEHLYVISFPERPGALRDFLIAMNVSCNISLFHYRGQGNDNSNVLIGFETDQVDALERSLEQCTSWYQKIESRTVSDFID